MAEGTWQDVGPVEQFQREGVSEASLGRQKVAVTWKDGVFGVVWGTCNHVGGPLGHGRLVGEYLVCPWHNWKFHRSTGKGEPGFEEDCVPAYEIKVAAGRLLVRTDTATERSKKPPPPHPLARPVRRSAGATRVVGISTTNMDSENPRYSTS